MKVYVKQFRQLKELSQEDLAQAAGVSRQSIYAIEVGKFTPTMLLGLKLSRILDQPVEVLFELEDGD